MRYQEAQPNALVLDYNRLFPLDPAKTHNIGGEVQADFQLHDLEPADRKLFACRGARFQSGNAIVRARDRTL